ncbi:hypothetical protein BD560DRAFT_387692 [Blakeslea trispora]|nr:hypothetical protein BD560DRAFT_387692 [Blakeslea trispora]
MRHPWIEGDVVMHDALPTWNQQSNLGYLLKEIRDEFIQRPPARKGLNDSSPQPTAKSEEGYGSRPPPPIPSHLNTAPAVNLEYSAISRLSQEDVEELLQNETAFEIFFNSLDAVKNLKNFQEDLRNANEQLAHKHLSREDQVIKARSEVEALFNQFHLSKLEFDQKEKLQQEAYNRFSSATVLTRLKASVYESDELSESVAQSFLDGNLDNDSFVKQFNEFRKVYHLRASKLERAQKDKLFVS